MTQTGRARGGLACAVLVGSLGLASCRGDTQPQVPTSFIKVSDNQTATVAKPVAIPPTVSIVDAEGRGIAGIEVIFALASGGGSLIGATATTSGDGVATAGSWTMGTTAGINTLTATAPNVPGSPVTFNAIAMAAAPASMLKVSSDPPSAPAGGNVDSIVVRVVDQYGNSVTGATVTFAVTSGGGSVSPTTVATGANGQAAARWIVGSSPNTMNTATATLDGVSTTITFGLTSGLAVSVVRFSSREYVVDSTAAITPAVTTVDPQGNTLDGAGFTLSVRSAATATVSGGTVTGARTGQTFLIATSVDNPSAKDSALLIVGNIASPVVRADVPRFDLRADTTFTVPVILDMRASAENAGAATIQLTWDPAVLTYMGNATGATVPAGSILVNTAFAASGSVTMTFADGSGFGGTVEVRTFTFKAASTASKTNLLLTTSDLVTATTLKDLLPKTVSSFYPFRIR
jgi:hypothetical protein